MTKANDLVGYFLVFLIAVSPIPFGSNPPFFWTLWGAVVGVISALYFFVALGSRSDLRVPFDRLRPYVFLWLGTAIWLSIQALPLGMLIGPFDFILADGSSVSSLALSLAPGQTWLMLIRMTTYALVFVLALQTGANGNRARLLLTLVFWAIVLHAAFSLVQLTQLGDTNLGVPKQQYKGVATGTFVNRNSFATFLAIGLSIGAALLPRVIWNPRARNQSFGDALFKAAIHLAGMFMVLVALFATESRMGLFAGAAGLLLVVVLILRWLPRAVVTIPVVVILSIGVAIAGTWILGQGVLERVLDLGGATTGRLDLYKQVWTMIGARPLLGYGGGAFELAYPSFFGPPLNLTGLYTKAHSTYLTLFSELGIIGGLLPMLIIGLVFLRVLWTQISVGDHAAPRLAAIGAIFTVAVHSIVDFSLEIQANAFLLTVLSGMSLASTFVAASRRTGVDRVRESPEGDFVLPIANR